MREIGRTTMLADPNGAAAILHLARPGLTKPHEASHLNPRNEPQALFPPRGKHSPPLIPQWPRKRHHQRSKSPISRPQAVLQLNLTRSNQPLGLP